MNRLTVWKNSVRQAIETYDCDYKPFGELDGGDEPTKHGFATAEYDGESSCFAMGMRMYSAEIGRFLSVDPLFEAMPRHTPYHYSFNSPLVWKDPSGLAPEKEKDQDRLMALYTYDVERAEAAYQGALVESNYRFMEAWANAVDSFFDLMVDWKNSPEARGGGGGGGRTGEDGSGENGSGNNGNESNTTNGSDGNKANSNGVSKEPTPWEHKGIYYETAEDLVAATQGPHHYFIPPDGLAHYDKPGIVCEADSYGTSSYNLLAKMYFHYQFGGRSDFIVNAFMLNFSHTNQGQLGLSGMSLGESRNINLFNGGKLSKIALAFGKVEMMKVSESAFVISSNPFDMNFEQNGSLSRNLGTFGAGVVFGQFFNTPIMPWAIIRNTFEIGGKFDVIFNGKVYIKE
ncbi:MAG: RHS repeat-associated core domain-containing protein [Desulfobulbaceae bacterium]|nr:RHS repeat-associated core domain-containing protein [Desulfobulbaceae bacterium]